MKNNFFIGQNIRQSHEERLTEVTLESLWNTIIQESGDLYKETQLIRKIARLDKGAAQRLKIKLPFFCCSRFSNGIRRVAQFEEASGFILDIDNLPPDNTLRNELFNAFRQNDQVAFIYRSPGGNGFKLVFFLEEPIHDIQIYNHFYKTFAAAFAQQYKLDNYIDTSTCDVTRVSFLCHDAEAWLNPIPTGVQKDKFLPAISFLPLADRENETVEEINDKSNESNRLAAEQYKEILSSLHPHRPARPEKQIYVPPQLREIVVHIQAQAALVGVCMTEARDIHYGKKIIFSCFTDFAEINLFYGKRGFSVIKSLKKGSNDTLAEIGERIVRIALTSADTVYKRDEY